MAESILSEVLSIILEKLSSKAYKEIMFTKDLDSHIKRLKQLKTTIEATILDAWSLESCTNAQKDVLQKLECALADLVYFLDVQAAKAKKKEIMNGNKFIKEVRLFFSKSNQLVSPFKDAHKLKAIIEQFQSISRDQALVRDIICLPSLKKTQMVSTGSLWSNCHVLTEVVVGRNNDRDAIVRMLLDDSETISVASIVGIGGVGKTTLAKYVYHDEWVKTWFDVHVWVSTTQDFDVHKILLQILATFQDEMLANCDVVQMYNFFKLAIGGKKLLLVLDNVWDQGGLRQKWLELRSLLALGANGSKVLVTTRNEKVSGIMGCAKPFMLGDLTREDTWLLFQKIAFTQFQEPGVEAIAREIVHMCSNVPLVIRSIGGLLAGKCTVKEWQAFRDDQLANFSSYGRDIIQTLKLSYDQLDERLKLCAVYCSLFPKWHTYNRHELIRLWISLGYVEPSYERQSLEDSAEEYLFMLGVQGFFVGAKSNTTNFVMQELMHDLVCSIVDFKYKVIKEDTCEIDERVHHLSLGEEVQETKTKLTKVYSSIFKLKQLQSLLILGSQYSHTWSSLYVSHIKFQRFLRLRILSLHHQGIQKVPSSLGELITLRYLNLSQNPITRLPNSITQLVELLSLDVSYCPELLELPKGINKLVKLRHFCNKDCSFPMPKGLARLTELQILDEFRIEFKEGFPRKVDCGLAELNTINNRIQGEIFIIVKGDAISRTFKTNEQGYESKGNLEYLMLVFDTWNTEVDETVVEALQPNTNLKELSIEKYKGERLPIWLKDGNHYFANLVQISLDEFEGCTSIGSFGKLRHLKELHCSDSNTVECIEENSCGVTSPHDPPLFPSLENLYLFEMPELKQWYNVSNGEESSTSSSIHVQHNILFVPQVGFPKLKKILVTKMEFFISMTREFRGFSSLEELRVDDCEDVNAIPDGISNLSKLKELVLGNCSEELEKRCEETIGEDWSKITHIPEVIIKRKRTYHRGAF